MKHSRYDEFYNYMSGNSKKNIGKKGINEDISTLINNFDEKLIYISKLLSEKYEDPDFYLLRHEYNKLHRGFLIRENILFSESKIFTYKGVKFECKPMVLSDVHVRIETTNRLIALHDFYRRKEDAEIVVLASPIILV